MIKKLIFTIIPFAALVILSSSTMSDNGKAGRTGAPGEQNCTNGCHSSYTINSGAGSISISCMGMPTNQYTPGQTYNMSVTVSQSGIGLFGVGVEAVVVSDTNTAGSFQITDAASTQLKYATIAGKARVNVVHTLNGGATSNSKVFNFNWTAPPQGKGDVKFYFEGVAANANTSDNGDWVYTGSQLFTESGCAAPAQPSAITGNLYNCDGSSAQYSVPPVSGATSYIWTLPSGWTTAGSTTESILVNAIGTSGDISVVAVNSCGNSTPTSYFVNVSPLPTATISSSNDTLFSVYGPGNQCQWYLNGSPINGATGNFYIPVANGNYSVHVLDPITICTGTSADFSVLNVGINSIESKNQLQVYPNPANNKIEIQIPENFKNASLTIYNVSGQSVLKTEVNEIINSINISELSEGVYTLVAQKGNDKTINRILVSRN